MLQKIRRTAAIICFILTSLLFFDFSGILHHWLGWLAKIQFIPALLALNVGVVFMLIAMTLFFGRVYCSVICPLGVFQDFVSRVAGKRKKNRFTFSPALHWLRYGVLFLFIIAFISGLGLFVAFLEPYSIYGRIASNLIAPLYQWVNNLLAYFSERINSYSFYSVDVWIKSILTFVTSIVTLVVIAVLAWCNGRTYCNTICPVGTILGFFARYSLLKPVINPEKCNECGLCSHNCKASCIDPKAHKIDYSRCVACMDCIDRCRRKAIKYELRKKTSRVEIGISPQIVGKNSNSRRNFLSTTALFAVATTLKAQNNVDGGLAIIKDKKNPVRLTQITPAGSFGASNFTQHCTACQLCISVCPNQVLHPSNRLASLMQPEMSYERGYCRPECVRCSEVCPSGAIKAITTSDKSSIQIGHAVWIKENCVVKTDNVSCGNCARHCPVGAIHMVPDDANNKESLKIPVINTERCIGCGACENLCPSRPFSAIYVEGHERHRII